MRDVGALERFGLSAVAGGLILSLFLFLTYVLMPAERWLEVRSIVVHDGTVGNAITMDVDREIHVSFDGEWRTAVWRAERGGWVPICSTGWREHHYRVDARTPDPTTLRWWTDEVECSALAPGLYRLDTEWIINSGTWFERDVSWRDVLFEVRP